MKKLEHNWRQKTLENLEKDFWDNSKCDSNLLKRCWELRKVTLDKFTTEDLRIMIGQQIGLNYLFPLAIESLTKDLFSEGDFYPGDLLKSVLSVDTNFWNTHKEWREKTATLRDAHVDWRLLMNLADSACRKEVFTETKNEN